MAGQLGLDPPTMTLHSGGPFAELEQALENSEAVAKSFNCSISTSAILFTIYCSKNMPLSERLKIQDKQDSFLKQMRILELEKQSSLKVLDAIFLYVLVPDQPKRAFVEVKPLLFFSKEADMANITVHNPSSTMLPNSWGFQQANWHDSCIQKCIVNGKICAVLSITNDTASKICSDSSDSKENEGGHHTSFIKVQMQRVSTFCIFLLDKVIIENDFSWEDIMTLRFYVPTNLDMDLETLSLGLTSAFKELSEVGRRIEIGTEREPMFNIIPVLGAGKSAASTNDLITCELLAQKS